MEGKVEGLEMLVGEGTSNPFNNSNPLTIPTLSPEFYVLCLSRSLPMQHFSYFRQSLINLYH